MIVLVVYDERLKKFVIDGDEGYVIGLLLHGGKWKKASKMKQQKEKKERLQDEVVRRDYCVNVQQ